MIYILIALHRSWPIWDGQKSDNVYRQVQAGLYGIALAPQEGVMDRALTADQRDSMHKNFRSILKFVACSNQYP